MRRNTILVGLVWLVSCIGVALLRIQGEVGLALLALGGLFALLLSIQCLRRRLSQRTWDGDLVWAMPLALTVVSLFLASLFFFPWLSDVATNIEAPPAFSKISPVDTAPPKYSDGHERALRSAYPDLKSQRVSYPPQIALAHALVAARQLPGWKTEFYEIRSNRIEGTTRSPLLGLKTQVVLLARKEGAKTVLDVRSRSALLPADFGENARIVRRFRKSFGESWICGPSAKGRR